VRIVRPRHHDVGTAADIRRGRGLGAQVFPAGEVDLDVDPGRLGELLAILEKHALVAVDELARAQDAQARTLLDRLVGRRHVVDDVALLGKRQARAQQGGTRRAGAKLDRIPSRKLHRFQPPLAQVSADARPQESRRRLVGELPSI
jgi:hypothetical protein